MKFLVALKRDDHADRVFPLEEGEGFEIKVLRLEPGRSTDEMLRVVGTVNPDGSLAVWSGRDDQGRATLSERRQP